MKDLRILLVGAGIAGFGVARALRQRGFVAEVVEREPAWTDVGAGIYLPGNTVRALRALGLESAVTERAELIPRQRFCDRRGNVLLDVDLKALWGDVAPSLALYRADLHAVLAFYDEAVPIRMGVSLRGLNQQDGTVTAEFDDGSLTQYDLVIGADGIHSQVRRWMFDDVGIRPVGQVAWRFVTECPPELTTWTVQLGHGVAFLAMPIGLGLVYCYCDAPAHGISRSGGAEVRARLAELTREFSASVPAILDSLGPEDAVHIAQIEEVTLNTWSFGPVLLIGDAAHATSPNMAEGAAMALEDGLVLAECLASGDGVAEAIATFEARRRPRTQWVLAQTHRRDRTRNLPPALRDFVLRRWGRSIVHSNYRPLLDPP